MCIVDHLPLLRGAPVRAHVGAGAPQQDRGVGVAERAASVGEVPRVSTLLVAERDARGVVGTLGEEQRDDLVVPVRRRGYERRVAGGVAAVDVGSAVDQQLRRFEPAVVAAEVERGELVRVRSDVHIQAAVGEQRREVVEALLCDCACMA